MAIHRRWMQFRLRTLMALTLLLGCGLMPLTWRMQEAQRQREAVDALLKLGVSITYDFSEVPIEDLEVSRPGPSWLRNLLGEEFFCRVVAVRWGQPMYRNHLTASGLGRICLAFGDTKRPSSTTTFAERWVGRGVTPPKTNAFTDSDAAHLAAFPKLRQLELAGAEIGDDGLRYLANLTDLEELDLSDTRITGKGLERLSKLTKLKRLRLSRTPVNDDGFSCLAPLENLESLDLEGATVGDQSLAVILGFERLTELDLRGTRVTEDGLLQLTPPATLKSAEVATLGVSQSGVADLRRKWPRVSIPDAGDSPLLAQRPAPGFLRLPYKRVQWNANGNVTLLDLSGESISTEHLALLKLFPDLTVLQMRRARLEPAMIENISRISSLTGLNLDESNLDDDGVKQLTQLPKLDVLMINNTNVSDNCLAALASMSQLRAVCLESTQVTAKGIEQLKKARPELRILTKFENGFVRLPSVSEGGLP